MPAADMSDMAMARERLGIAQAAGCQTANPAYQSLLAKIESGEPGMHIACPHCESRAHIRTSKPMTKLTREAYCQCTNLACGHTFRAVLEVVQTISPSAVPDPLISAQLQHSARAIEMREREQHKQQKLHEQHELLSCAPS